MSKNIIKANNELDNLVFYSYEGPRIRKGIETESRMELTKTWGERGVGSS